MSKKDRHKLEKKRRAEREHRREKQPPLAYRGNKFRTEKLVPFFLTTETGIYEAWRVSHRELTDHDVRRALEKLIRGIRSGAVSLPNDEEQRPPTESLDTSDFLTANILNRWRDYAKNGTFPIRDNVIGVLRTTLGSIEVWGNISPTSRGYLGYLEGFLRKLGVSVEEVDPANRIEAEEKDEEELLAAGRAWCRANEPSAKTFFLNLADEMIRSGQRERVAETCQQLIGESFDQEITRELSVLSLRAEGQLPSLSNG